MRLTFLFLILTVTTTTGCATGRLRMMERANIIQAEFAEGSDNEYYVSMYETKYFGWDGGNEKTRRETLSLMFDSSCKKVTLISEVRAEVKSKDGSEMLPVWVQKVHCEKK